MSIQLVIQVYLPGAVRWFTHLYSYILICDHSMFNVIVNVRKGSQLDVLSHVPESFILTRYAKNHAICNMFVHDVCTMFADVAVSWRRRHASS
jgi:hypothetical protein